MKSILLTTLLVFLAGCIGYVFAAGVQKVSVEHDDRRTEFQARPYGKNETPASVVEHYVFESSACGAGNPSRYTALMPEDYMLKLQNGDKRAFEKTIRTPEGQKSQIGIIQKELHRLMNEHVSNLICQAKFSFGNVLDEEIRGDYAAVKFDFLMPDGNFGNQWGFMLARIEGQWKIIRLSEGFDSASETEPLVAEDKIFKRVQSPPRKASDKPLYEIVPRTPGTDQ